MKESAIQSKIIKEIERRFPDAIVLKTDPNYLQGIPDLLVLYGSKWAALECKRCATAQRQPNQEYYLNRMDTVAFAAIIHPDNIDEVLTDLWYYFYKY